MRGPDSARLRDSALGAFTTSSYVHPAFTASGKARGKVGSGAPRAACAGSLAAAFFDASSAGCVDNCRTCSNSDDACVAPSLACNACVVCCTDQVVNNSSCRAGAAVTWTADSAGATFKGAAAAKIEARRRATRSAAAHIV